MNFSLSSWILFAHILSAMVLLGSSLFSPLVRSGVQRAKTIEELRGWLDLGRRAARANPFSSLVLLATGLWLGSQGWWSAGWFWVALGGWAANVVLVLAIVQRQARSLARAAFGAAPGPIPPEIDAHRRWVGVGIAQRAITANDLALLFLMIETPDVAWSLGAIAVANLLLAVPALVHRVRSGPVAAAELAAVPGRIA